MRYWVGATPEQWRADFARMATRMRTDAPSAGLEEPEQVGTVERVIELDERNTRMNPRQRLFAAVKHLPSGTLAGFTQLSVAPQPNRAVDQYATLVLREDRGHRLGMLLKAVGFARAAGAQHAISGW